MIVTVTLNAALDVTYRIDQVHWNGVNRVRDLHRRAGGKGVNVARVLATLGHDVLVTGLAGGPTGRAVELDLTASALPHALTPIGDDSRTTLAVTGPSGTALFNEPGPRVTREELTRFLDGFVGTLTGAAAVVISGSLPRGVPAGFYATLAAHAADRGIPALVDADGEALRRASAGRPAIVKPNLEELARAFPADALGPESQAELMRKAGAAAVVVSLGHDGLLAVTAEGTWRARMPYRVAGNPTGAGDAFVAGLAMGVVEGMPWPERLRLAAALGAAAVAMPVAGEIDHGTFQAVHRQINVS
ncbi:1-phosphofructokinase family hexose kinase [Streptosporangium subroseum]|uniref:1-phosphofructokinase family hexose kinase n=1 Tax=Streptosporangium subroseum TaxID=106412 RepID=UPI003430B3F0